LLLLLSWFEGIIYRAIGLLGCWDTGTRRAKKKKEEEEKNKERKRERDES